MWLEIGSLWSLEACLVCLVFVDLDRGSGVILFVEDAWIVCCVNKVNLKAAALTLFIFHLGGCAVFISQTNLHQHY